VKGVTATLLWIVIRPVALEIPAVVVTMIFMVNSFVLGYVIRRVFTAIDKRRFNKNVYYIDGKPYHVEWIGTVKGVEYDEHS